MRKRNFILACCLSAMLAMPTTMAGASGITVKTDTRYARGATMAFGRMTVKGTGTTEKGFCWSETPEPTVDDNKTTKKFTNNGFIFCLEGLKPGTRYYMRAYAIDKAGEVIYGDVIKFYTIPKGKITYDIRNDGTAEVKERITNAVKDAVGYWNNLTSISGFHTSVGFVDGVPTADCSYGGWIRVGANASYQRTGTILHELLHGVGVIPWADTEWSRHNLRASYNNEGYGTGEWLGDRVTEVVRFLDNSPSAKLNGDYQHMWPYGINGAHEDTGKELLYIGNSLIIQALGEDGLQHTSTSFSRPYYAFAHEDNEKYYIKNESKDRGLLSSYLIPTPEGNLVWREMTTAEVAANDSAAWTVTFTPENQYYQIRNAATGEYISYTNSGINGIKMAGTDSPGSFEDFQLMRGRKDVQMVLNGPVYRGYWLIHPESNWTPRCLQANTKGVTVATTFNIADTAEKQRWIFLTSGDLNNFPTAISQPTVHDASSSSASSSSTSDIFTASGRKVGQGKATLSTLPDGIYIINGKKVINCK